MKTVQCVPIRSRSGSAMTGVPPSATGFGAEVAFIVPSPVLAGAAGAAGAADRDRVRLGFPASGRTGLRSAFRTARHGYADGRRDGAVRCRTMSADDGENFADHPRMQPRRLVDGEMVDVRVAAYIDIGERAVKARTRASCRRNRVGSD